MNAYSKLAQKRQRKLPPCGIQAVQSALNNAQGGPYKYPNGNTYKGQFKNGLRTGFGEETTPNGHGYIGQWNLDQKHGKGRLLLNDGDYYEGDFFEGLPNGNGILIRNFKQDKITYTGEFKAGMQDGTGTETFPQGA